jgi:hypothetical protein
MIMQDFLTEIEKTYSAHFPYSRVSVQFNKNLYSSIFIRCYLAGDKIENSGKSWDNDMFMIIFQIDTTSGEFPRSITLDSVMPDNLVMESTYNHYHIKPDSPYLVYSSKKPVNYRKVKGDYHKILNTFDKYCNGLKESLLDDLSNDRIHPNYKSIVMAKVTG